MATGGCEGAAGVTVWAGVVDTLTAGTGAAVGGEEYVSCLGGSGRGALMPSPEVGGWIMREFASRFCVGPLLFGV